MASNQAYDIAFEYKKTKLWKKLWDKDLIAVKLDDGTIGYVTVMGHMGSYCAVAVYPGEAGYRSLRQIVSFDPETSENYFDRQEMILSQYCYQLVLESKDDLEMDEIEEVRAYAKAKGIRLSGKNAYPHYLKYIPKHLPWPIGDAGEEKMICDVVRAMIDLSHLLAKKKPAELGILSVEEDTKDIPLMECIEGHYEITGRAPLPKLGPAVYPAPASLNEISLRKLKKMKNKAIFECEITTFPEPIQEKPNEAPYFPNILMVTESESMFTIPPDPVRDYDVEPERVVNHLVDMLIEYEICPAKLYVRNERTYTLLEMMAKKLSCPIEIKQDLPALDDSQDKLLMFMDDMDNEVDDIDQLIDMAEMILELPAEAIDEMPDEIRNEMVRLIAAGIFPEDLEEDLILKLGLDIMDF